MPPATFLYVWTPGTDRFLLPPQAGFRVGPTGAKFMLMALHYNNPALKPGYFDSSGFILYLDDNLRPNDAASFSVSPSGPVSLGVVPALTQNWTMQGGALASSTQSFLTDHGIPELFIFGEFVHMHKYGMRGLLTITRNGQLVHSMDTNPYDYNAQDVLQVNYTIVPSDQILMWCIWDTLTPNRSTGVTWGSSTEDEMCSEFFLYYPEVPYFGGWGDPSLFVDGHVCNSAPNC